MTRLLAFCVGLVLFLAGIASLPFPIPGGIFALAVGMVLLIYSSPGFEGGVRGARARWGWCNQAIAWIEVRVGKRVGGVLQSTRPPSGPKDKGC